MRGTINNYRGDAKITDNRRSCSGRKLKKEVWNKACAQLMFKIKQVKLWIFYSTQLVCNHDGDQFLKVTDLLKLGRFSTLVKFAKNETWKVKYRFWGDANQFLNRSLSFLSSPQLKMPKFYHRILFGILFVWALSWVYIKNLRFKVFGD